MFKKKRKKHSFSSPYDIGEVIYYYCPYTGEANWMVIFGIYFHPWGIEYQPGSFQDGRLLPNNDRRIGQHRSAHTGTIRYRKVVIFSEKDKDICCSEAKRIREEILHKEMKEKFNESLDFVKTYLTKYFKD